jgi:pimeloyl-ACP methyl ester carboxylesterase
MRRAVCASVGVPVRPAANYGAEPDIVSSVPQIEIADGRKLEFVEAGDPGGVPVVVHHGTPGSAVLHPEWAPSAAAEGLRLVIASRAGYGNSTRDRGRSVAAAAGDTAALADAVGADRFLTFGFSGGGPHALACAALLPDRVVAAASLGSIAPYGAPGLDFFAGMGEENIAEFTTVRDGGEAAIRPLAEEQAAALRDATPEQLVDEMATLLTPADADELRGPIGATLLRQFQQGMAVSVDGWIDDDLAFVRPWGFKLSELRVPVLLWQGRQDAMVPFGHGEWLASRIPGVEAELSEVDGHLALLTRRAPELFRWLRARWDDGAA